jgi:excisionase family DNA binding protein
MTRLVVVELEELKELIDGAVKSALSAQGPGTEWLDAQSAPMGVRLFRRLAREGAFPAVKCGRQWRAQRSDVDAYMAQLGPLQRPLEVPDPVRQAIEAGRLRVIRGDLKR